MGRSEEQLALDFLRYLQDSEVGKQCDDEETYKNVQSDEQGNVSTDDDNVCNEEEIRHSEEKRWSKHYSYIIILIIANNYHLSPCHDNIIIILIIAHYINSDGDTTATPGGASQMQMSAGRRARRRSAEERARQDTVVLQAGDYIGVRIPFAANYEDQEHVRGRVCEIDSGAGGMTMTLETEDGGLVNIFDDVCISVFMYNDEYEQLSFIPHVLDTHMKISRIHGGSERLRRRRLRKSYAEWNENLARQREEAKETNMQSLVQSDFVLSSDDTASAITSGEEFFRNGTCGSDGAVTTHSTRVFSKTSCDKTPRKNKTPRKKSTPKRKQSTAQFREGARRKSPRKRAVSLVNNNTIALVSTMLGAVWSKAMFGTYASASFCTAVPARNRDKIPQYGYLVRALQLCGNRDYPECIVWLTDVQQRDGRAIWASHGQRLDVHYTLKNKTVVEVLKRSYVCLSKEPPVFRCNIHHLSTKEEIQRALNSAVLRLTNLKYPPPQWKRNSCHLDCFLLSELAFYTANVDNIAHDVHAFPRVTQRLLRVLVTLGIYGFKTLLEQDVFRDDYRTYELSQLTEPARAAMEATDGTGDYAWHSHMVTSLAKREGEDSARYMQEERMIGIGVKQTCSSPIEYHNGGSVTYTKYLTFIPATINWYPRCDRVASTTLRAADFEAGEGGIEHGSLQNNVLSHILRPVGDETPCCENDWCVRHMAKVTYEKIPTLSRLPRSLEIDSGLNPAYSNKQTEFSLLLGTHTYQLIAIVLESKGHFTLIVKLGKKWWYYDDRRKEHYVDSTKGLPTLVPLDGEEGVQRELKNNANSTPQFLPRIWRYAMDSSAMPLENNIISTEAYTTVAYMDPVLSGGAVLDETLLRLK